MTLAKTKEDIIYLNIEGKYMQMEEEKRWQLIPGFYSQTWMELC